MSDTYTKLFSSITASTIWSEPAGTRLVWITMLAMADKQGDVHASVPGLARIANVSLPDTEIALAALTAPDKYSRTPDHDGRRIEAIDGGWRLLNYAKYAAIRSADERREYWRQWKANKRAGGVDSPQCPQVPPPVTESTPSSPTPSPVNQEHAAQAAPAPPPRRTRKSVQTDMPEGFAVSERVSKWAAAKGFTRVPEHFEAFVSKSRAKGYRYADWDEALMNAIRSDWAELKTQQPTAGSGAHRPYVPEKRERRDPSLGAPAEFSTIASKLGLKGDA